MGAGTILPPFRQYQNCRSALRLCREPEEKRWHVTHSFSEPSISEPSTILLSNKILFCGPPWIGERCFCRTPNTHLPCRFFNVSVRLSSTKSVTCRKNVWRCKNMRRGELSYHVPFGGWYLPYLAQSSLETLVQVCHGTCRIPYEMGCNSGHRRCYCLWEEAGGGTYNKLGRLLIYIYFEVYIYLRLEAKASSSTALAHSNRKTPLSLPLLSPCWCWCRCRCCGVDHLSVSLRGDKAAAGENGNPSPPARPTPAASEMGNTEEPSRPCHASPMQCRRRRSCGGIIGTGQEGVRERGRG